MRGAELERRPIVRFWLTSPTPDLKLYPAGWSRTPSFAHLQAVAVLDAAQKKLLNARLRVVRVKEPIWTASVAEMRPGSYAAKAAISETSSVAGAVSAALT